MMRRDITVSIIPAPESGFKFVAVIFNRANGKTHKIYNDSKSMLRESARAYLKEVLNVA